MFSSPFTPTGSVSRSHRTYKRKGSEPLISPLQSPLHPISSRTQATPWLSIYNRTDALDDRADVYQTIHTKMQSSDLAAINNVPPLTPSQELFALVLHLTSSDMNGLPPLDPSLPLNPDFVLDTALPTEHDDRQAALRRLEKECWDAWPVVVLGRQNDVFTEEAVSLLQREDYLGTNGRDLGIVYLDGRPDTVILTSLLNRLTRQPTLPTILIGGHPIGTFGELKFLHDQGRLAIVLSHAGIPIGDDLRSRKARERSAAIVEKNNARQ
ncbi:Thioredoxin-like fold [Phaffia rhodozyma]|uniref:Thioredoxin-like fold n=1 Tax=Phaffia rhodozyma TaxID=264483 RepID=A0A0F7SJE3_PHARH|nr:Thioredoxin-like fold [Phaffia rhodozyma]